MLGQAVAQGGRRIISCFTQRGVTAVLGQAVVPGGEGAELGDLGVLHPTAFCVGLGEQGWHRERRVVATTCSS